MNLYTIGYQGHTPTSLVAALQEHGVLRLVDVRDTPWSPAPQWQQAALRHHAKTTGVAYLHVPQAGNPREIRDRAKTLLAAGRPRAEAVEWALAQYRLHLRDTSGLVVRIAAQLQDGDCLLCACRDADRCHRSVLVKELEAERARRDGAPSVVVHIPARQAERAPTMQAQGRLL